MKIWITYGVVEAVWTWSDLLVCFNFCVVGFNSDILYGCHFHIVTLMWKWKLSYKKLFGVWYVECIFSLSVTDVLMKIIQGVIWPFY